MSSNWVVIAFAVFSLKHFIVDFPLQPAWMYRNKADFGHPGGLAHSAFHGVVTTGILLSFWHYGIVGEHVVQIYAITTGLFEFTAHYCIDYAKMNINRYLGWGPTTCEQFWWLLGFDQLLHYLTYCIIIWYWFA